MIVLVTGASGGLGRRLLPRLARRGELRVRALVHRTPPPATGGETVPGSLEDPRSLSEAMRGVHTVLHLAALTYANDVRRYERINREGTENVVAACESAGVSRLIYVSSSAAHPRGGGYAASKWAAERAVERAACAWLVLRPTEVYGGGTREGVHRLLEWVRRWPVVPVVGDGRCRICPVSAEDVDEALERAVLRADLAGRTLVLGGPEVMTLDALIDRLARYYGVRRLKLHLPRALAEPAFALAARLRPAKLARDQVARLVTDKEYDVETAPRLLGLRPRRLEDGLRALGL
jgi:NADH dehydrogenase